MITITPKTPPPNCSAEPQRIFLPGKVTVRFRAHSDHAGGEPAIVVYDLGENSEVVFKRSGATRERRTHFVRDSNTPIEDELALMARAGEPCGRLGIKIWICPEGSDDPDDQCLTFISISCA
jgi:hypothetical protein